MSEQEQEQDYKPVRAISDSEKEELEALSQLFLAARTQLAYDSGKKTFSSNKDAYTKGWVDAGHVIFDLLEPRRSRVLPASLCIAWISLVIFRDHLLESQTPDDLHRALIYSQVIGDLAEMIQGAGETIPEVLE